MGSKTTIYMGWTQWTLAEQKTFSLALPLQGRGRWFESNCAHSKLSPLPGVHKSERDQTTPRFYISPLERTEIRTTFPSLMCGSGAILVQNTQHSTETTPLTENITPIYGALQKSQHTI